VEEKGGIVPSEKTWRKKFKNFEKAVDGWKNVCYDLIPSL